MQRRDLAKMHIITFCKPQNLFTGQMESQKNHFKYPERSNFRLNIINSQTPSIYKKNSSQIQKTSPFSDQESRHHLTNYRIQQEVING